VLPTRAEFFDDWVCMCQLIAECDIDVALTFLKQTPDTINVHGNQALLLCGQRAIDAMNTGRHMWKSAKAYLEEMVFNRFGLAHDRWKFNLEQASRISKRSPEAAEEFIRSGCRVCIPLNEEDTRMWVNEGLRTCKSEADLMSYFSGISLKAVDIRDGLVSGVTLKDRVGSLSLICEAYLGRRVKVLSNKRLVGVEGFSCGAATDGRFIYLPEVAENFELMKLMALHQATFLNAQKWGVSLNRCWPSDPKIHVEIDRKLVEILPGITEPMRAIGASSLDPEYPSGQSPSKNLPWWGDFIPGLILETQANVRLVKGKLSDAANISSDLIEMIMDSLMIQGSRDQESLLARLGIILANLDFESPDPEEVGLNVQTFLYKEWDCNLSDYKLDWCLVRKWVTSQDPNTFASDLQKRRRGIINLIRGQFMKLKPERFRKFRAQTFGDDIDIDALVDAIAEKRAEGVLSDKIYVRRDKKERNVAVLFLVDLSGSTEQELNGFKFVDVEKEAMGLMAEALDSLGDTFAIYGFNSEGRFRVNVFMIKNFNEDYGETARYRLGNLEAAGLTRLGAVVRHGIAEMDNVSAENKLMVILTDGRPYDLEYGGLDYAIEDTRKALKEARTKKIHPFIITSDKKGASYLKQISPQAQNIILPRAEMLPRILPAIYKRLTL
ncbi:MAG: nitric oxide reductase activation protein NorD, partial [Desulfomonilaceae bacterium]